MATVTSSRGTQFHLFSLLCSVKDLTEHIEFSELENELSDSVRSQRLYGSIAGNRSWSLTLPTLPDSVATDQQVAGVAGGSLSRSAYIWELFCETKATGKPFAFKNPQNNQYYLCDFADKKLSMQRIFSKLYSSGIEIRQRRLDGETVFDVASMTNSSYFNWYNETSHGTSVWNNKTPGGVTLVPYGDVVFGGNPQNGKNTVRLSGSTANGQLQFQSPLTLADAFIVFKVRNATFNGTKSIIHPYTGSSNPALLQGLSGTVNLSSLFVMQINGVVNAIAGPMNKFGVVMLSSNITPNQNVYMAPALGWILGSNPSDGGQNAPIDIAEVILSSVSVPRNEWRELVEHFQIKWGI